MADTVSIKDSNNDPQIVSTDEVTIDAVLQHVQRVKIGLGANNAWDKDVDSGQQTMADSLPVVIASNQDFIKAEDDPHSSADKGIMSLAVRSDSPTSLVDTDGDYSPLITDANGNLYVNSKLFSRTVTDNITSNGDTVTLETTGLSHVRFWFSAVGSGIAFTTEVSYDGGSNYVNSYTWRLDAQNINMAATGHSSPSTSRHYISNVAGATHFRIRATSYSSGTYTIVIVGLAGGDFPFLQNLEGGVASITVSNTVALVADQTEDASASTGFTGVPPLPVRRDTPAASGANGDFVELNVSNIGGLWSHPIGNSLGGATTYTLNASAASTNATSVKASAGTLYSATVFNLNASPRYFKLYNKASSPTVGTDTPVATFMIPGNASGAGFNIQFPVGAAFATGIAYALTTGMATSDTGAVAASEITVHLTYV